MAAINGIRQHLHEHSPFADEPTDCVQWVPGDEVQGNEYNPNTVAPPEMKLLTLSVEADGFTQPIVVHQIDGHRYEIVDGFHRHRVGSRSAAIKRRLHGFLPVVTIRAARADQTDRIASTIRHNRARGIHGVAPMTDIVVSLLRAGWSDADIAKELGMDPEEVFRFKQVSGLPDLFQKQPYSRSWD
ncbi:Co-activator of prophage gene expression IbrB [Candidatus Burkholderia verschuerenii]|uniref:Co-activator of prophage gene expression IbrB n=1 Tax=Candidatus Burkholderia verschuerenii TaxID=242163 RepID=A0A0L0MIF7_9BURK|nr:ParB/RepB/Spo0J family partition protein [Candidatus Burkholderia verschuerenii]KND62070.1 Co-activator of prophage gene expression IbrB [Candidatus Burkholderia verschuerenii]